MGRGQTRAAGRPVEETKRLILDAATTEFAARGLSGARVDRIAALSGVNKRMIYVYFGSKEHLFDRVLADSLSRLVDAAPFDGRNLDTYAGDLFDAYSDDPTVIRLSMWRTLERPQPVGLEEQTYARKLAQIDEARASDGDTAAGEGLEAAEILSYILALARSWLQAPPPLAGRLSRGSDRATQRRHIELAVRRFLGDAR